MPAVPLTAMVTDKDCAVVMLEADGVTLTVGVALFTNSVSALDVLAVKFASPP